MYLYGTNVYKMKLYLYIPLLVRHIWHNKCVVYIILPHVVVVLRDVDAHIIIYTSVRALSVNYYWRFVCLIFVHAAELPA